MNNSFDNITTRRRHSTELEEDLHEITYQSLPDPEYSKYESEEGIETKRKIDTLSAELKIANQEIDTLNLENDTLKKDLIMCQNKLKIFKSVGIDDLTSSPKKSISPQYRKIKTTNMQIGFPRTSPNQFTSNVSKLISCTDAINGSEQNERHTLHTKISHTDKNKVYTPSEDVATILPLPSHNVVKKKVILFSDGEAKGMRPLLQNLLGDEYIVTSILKPDATIDQILCNCEIICKEFDKDDYVIILTKSNDKNPMKFQSFLYYYLNSLQNTNVIVGEVCKSRYLNESKLNDLIRLVCNDFKFATFVKYSDSNMDIHSKFFKCKILLREILKIRNEQRLLENMLLKNENCKSRCSMVEKCTQTNDLGLHENCEFSQDPSSKTVKGQFTPVNNGNKLFRESNY